MSTNKQAFKKAYVKEKSVNYNLVFRRYGERSLTETEYIKLCNYLKPLYVVIEDDLAFFKYPSQSKTLKLIQA